MAAVGTIYGTWKSNKKIQEVHILVDGRLDNVLTRVDQLTDALESANVPVPPEKETKYDIEE